MNDNTFSKLSNMIDDSTKLSNNNDFKDSFNDNVKKNSENENNNFDFTNLDFETINKIKNIMNKFRSNQYSPRSNLLNSLKPYLRDSKKEKIDQYMQFANMISIMETINNTGDIKNEFKFK